MKAPPTVEQKARWQARQKERYATDPEYREKRLTQLREWRHKNVAKVREYQRKTIDKQPEKYRMYRRTRLYGITPEQYLALLGAQQGRCPICKTDLGVADPRKIHVDHDHQTGVVRGILCHSCNPHLGVVETRGTGWLDSALTYLGWRTT